MSKRCKAQPTAPPVDPQLVAIRVEAERVIRAAADLAERATWPRATSEVKARAVVELAKTADELRGLADGFDDCRQWWIPCQREEK